MKNNSNNGLSPTMVLRYLHSKFGTMVQKIELTDQEMMRIVFQQSLPTFSQYFPFLPMVTLSKQRDKIPGTLQDYRIPNQWNLQILSLHKHYLSSECRYGSGWIAPIMANPIDSQIVEDNYSSYVTPITPIYIPPNRITFTQNFYMMDYITLQFKAVHPEHLKTIQPNLRDEFLQLCFLDVCIALYPMRHRFSSINTAYGTLEPFTEILDNAKDERQALLEKWRINYLFSGDQKKIWIG